MIANINCRHAESQPDYAELLAKHSFALHTNPYSTTLSPSLDPTLRWDKGSTSMHWAVRLWGIGFVLSSGITALSTFAAMWLAEYRRAMDEEPRISTQVLIMLIVPALKPGTCVCFVLMIAGLAAYLSTMDRMLGVLILVILALCCLWYIVLKALGRVLRPHRRHHKSDRELGLRPRRSRFSPPRDPRNQPDTQSDDSSDPGEDGPSGEAPRHRRNRLDHRPMTTSVADHEDRLEGRLLINHLGEAEPESMQSLNGLLLSVRKFIRGALGDSPSIQAALLFVVAATLIIL